MEEVKQNKWETLFEQFLITTEFALEYHKQVDEENEGKHWGLYDEQGVNLGDIDQDRFATAEEILDRMSIYIDDYFYRDLEEEAEVYELNTPSMDFLVEKYGKTISYRGADYWLAIRQELGEDHEFVINHKYEFDILDMIANHTQEINLFNIHHEEVE